MGFDKLWANCGGRPLLALTLEGVVAAGIRVASIAAPAERHDDVASLARAAGVEMCHLVAGGSSRQESVSLALGRLEEADYVCVHDAARPLTPVSCFERVLAAAARWDAATTAVPPRDSIKRVQAGRVVETLVRDTLMSVQTPQAFRTSLLRMAHERAIDDGAVAEDDCTLVERLGHAVAVVDGDDRALKVTRPTDLTLVQALLGLAG